MRLRIAACCVFSAMLVFGLLLTASAGAQAQITLTPAQAPAAPAPSYCPPLLRSKGLATLPTALAATGIGHLSRFARGSFHSSSDALRRAYRLAPSDVRRDLRTSSRTLATSQRHRRLTRHARHRLGVSFERLAPTAGVDCGLPTIAAVGDLKSAARRAAGRTVRASPIDDFRPSGPFSFFARPRGVDVTLCANRSDARVTVPMDFFADGCWSGTDIFVRNRSSLVLRVSHSGSVTAPYRIVPFNHALASTYVANNNADDIVPPGYEVSLRVQDATAGSVSVGAASYGVLKSYAIAHILEGAIPGAAGITDAALDWARSVSSAVDDAINCASGANAFKLVICSTKLNVAVTKASLSFGASAGINAVRVLGHIPGVLWQLVQLGNFTSATADDALKLQKSARTVPVAAAGPPPSTTTTTATTTPPTSTTPPQTTTTGSPPPAPATFAETQGHHGANSFTNYHNASGVGPPVGAMSTVQVSCKVFDPYIQSVSPDGYWYRLAQSPWNGAYYAAANTFFNGDPVNGPYTHNTDFVVPDC